MSNKNIPADWQALNATLDKKRRFAHSMGGEEKLAKRNNAGRLNAREWIELLSDTDCFQEIGTLVGSHSYQGEKLAPADALIGGISCIAGQQVVIAVEDFTVQGGSIGHGTNAKRVRLATMALEQKLPFIMLLDGAGARMSNALSRHPYGPNDLQIIAKLIGKVPTIGVIIGSSAGHGAVGAVMMDLVIMLEDASLFTAGPPLVQAATGEVVDKYQLGGAAIHSKHSGVAELVARDAIEAKHYIENYLELLLHKARDYNRHSADQEELYHVIPANLQLPYDMKAVINILLDTGSLLELKPEFAQSMITALGRLNGKTIAVIANQPQVLAGAIDSQAAEKATEFIESLDSFNIPFLFLADTPGVMSGSQAEKQGTLRAAASMYKAVQNMQSKKLHVTVRKAFGFASCIMAMNPFDHQVISLGLPGVSLGGMPVMGGAEVAKIGKEETQRIKDAQLSGAWSAADALAYDEIVKPCELRDILDKALKPITNLR